MRNIRRGVFETNSSSVHSITMCMEDDFRKFENGETWHWTDGWDIDDSVAYKEFVTPGEAREILKHSKYRDANVDLDGMSDEELLEYDNGEHFESYDTIGRDWYESYTDSFTTPSGERVYAFGYYGHD